MVYIDCGGPPEEIVRMVKTRLKQRNLEGMLARKMARYMWGVKQRIWEMDRQIPSLLELIFRIKLAKIAKGRSLLSLLEML